MLDIQESLFCSSRPDNGGRGGPMKMIKTVSILILISMLLAMLSSCGSQNGSAADAEGSGSTESGTAAVTREYDVPEALEALDYGGEKVTVLCRTGGMVGENDFFSDELMNMPVEDAIYNRTQVVSDMIGVEFVDIKMPLADVLKEMTLQMNTGDPTYDIVECSAWRAIAYIVQGYMRDIITEGGEYLDLDSPWWSHDWIDEAVLGNGSLYFITGAPALSLYRLIFVMFYNKDMGEELKVEDLYKVVEEGRWTLDYVADLIAPLYSDMNGNDQHDIEDRYGLVLDHGAGTDPYWSACDISIFSRDDEGWFIFSDKDIEKISSVFDKLYAIIYDNPGNWNTAGTSNVLGEIEMMFASGRTLLANEHLRYAEYENFRNMQDEYGILPLPKYDEKQKDYYSFVHDQYSVFIIPQAARDPELSGAALEALAYENYCSVLPVYYDLVLKGRYANDPQTRKMIDIITSGVRMDSAWIYGNVLNDPCQSLIRNPMSQEKRTFGSDLAEVKKKVSTLLKIIAKEVSALDS